MQNMFSSIYKVQKGNRIFSLKVKDIQLCQGRKLSQSPVRKQFSVNIRRQTVELQSFPRLEERNDNLLSDNFFLSVCLHPGGGEVVVLQGLVQGNVEVILNLFHHTVIAVVCVVGFVPSRLLSFRPHFSHQRCFKIDRFH